MKYLKKYNEDINWDWIEEDQPDIPDDFKDHEKFHKFLIDNGVLDKFIHNFNNYKIERIENLNILLDKHKPRYLLWAFNWYITFEGHIFWSQLNEKWNRLNHINENKNENKFKIGEYAIWKPFNNERVKILDITDNRTIWIQDKDGNIGEWLIKDFIPEIEYLQKNYNL